MKKQILILLTLLACLAFQTDCHQKKTPSGPEDNDPLTEIVYGDTANATATCPQYDIDWPSLADSPWPMAFQNPQCVNRSANQGPDDGEIIMAIGVRGTQTNESQPAIGNLSIYCTSNPGTGGLQAFSLDGDSLWHITGNDVDVPTANQYYGTPLIDGEGIVYTGAGHSFDISGINAIFAVFSTGEIKWKKMYDYAVFSHINVGPDGTLYFCTADGWLHAVQMTDGTELWQTKGSSGFSNMDYIHPMPISPDGEQLYVSGDNGCIDAINTTDGSVLWSYDVNLLFYDKMVDNAGRIYSFAQINGQGWFICLNESGSELWKYKVTENPVSKGHCVMDYNGLIYLLVADRLFCLDYQGDLRWRRDLNNTESRVWSFESSYLYCDSRNYIYGLSCLPGALYALNSRGDFIINHEIGIGHDLSAAIGPEGTMVVITDIDGNDDEIDLVIIK